MKKRYRIGICLTLVICLLFLSACGNQADTAATEATQPATTAQSASAPTQPLNTPTATAETTATQPSGNPTDATDTKSSASAEDNKSNLPEELAFNWENSFIEVRNLQQASQILSYGQLESGMRLTFDTCQDAINQVLLFNWAPIDNPYALKLKTLAYPSNFFKNNSLILIGARSEISALEVTDVTYRNGVLHCSVTRTSDSTRSDTVYSEMFTDGGFFYCFIEIDSVLPEGTEIVVEITDVAVEKGAYKEAINRFTEKCIYHSYFDSILD